jgi:cysteine-rich repeat protein
MFYCATGFHGGCGPNPCGNGVLQPAKGEECDDGNHAPADGCSGLCKSELAPTSCAESSPSAYLTAHANDPEFNGMYEYAQNELGLGSPLSKVLACNEGNGTTAYLAAMGAPDGTGFAEAIIYSRKDMPHGFNTYVFTEPTDQDRYVYFPDLTMHFKWTANFGSFVGLDFLDGEGDVIPPPTSAASSAPLAASVSPPTCAEYLRETQACAWEHATGDLSLLVGAVVNTAACLAAAVDGGSTIVFCSLSYGGMAQMINADCPTGDGKPCLTEDDCKLGKCEPANARRFTGCKADPNAQSQCVDCEDCQDGKCVEEFKIRSIDPNPGLAQINGVDAVESIDWCGQDDVLYPIYVTTFDSPDFECPSNWFCEGTWIRDDPQWDECGVADFTCPWYWRELFDEGESVTFWHGCAGGDPLPSLPQAFPSLASLTDAAGRTTSPFAYEWQCVQ